MEKCPFMGPMGPDLAKVQTAPRNDFVAIQMETVWNPEGALLEEPQIVYQGLTSRLDQLIVLYSLVRGCC